MIVVNDRVCNFLHRLAIAGYQDGAPADVRARKSVDSKSSQRSAALAAVLLCAANVDNGSVLAVRIVAIPRGKTVYKNVVRFFLDAG